MTRLVLHLGLVKNMMDMYIKVCVSLCPDPLYFSDPRTAC